MNVGNLIKSGPTAKSGIGTGCGTTQAPAHSENTILTVDVSPAARTGVINTSADGLILPDGTQKATATADTHGAVLLGGLITADEVKAVSTITHNGTGFRASAAGSELLNLVVAGNVISANTASNTKITLTGLGYVVINEQITKATATKVSLTVNNPRVYYPDKRAEP